MEVVNQFLQIPDRCLLNKKITKAFYKRNFDLTTSEKALLEDPEIMVAVNWLASISPDTANINSFQQDNYLFEEVQIISVQTTERNFSINQQKIADLIQKYIPYPILLTVFTELNFILNTCDKRINQNDSSRRTIERRYFTEAISLEVANDQENAFLKSISFGNLDKTNLKTLYESYSRCIIALQASALNGLFIPRTQIRTQENLIHLENIETLKNEIITLQNLAKKEKQLKQQINLNTQVQMKREEIEHLKTLIINF